jgi:gluconokinase
MQNALVASFDAGTTSVKTLVFDQNAAARFPLPSVPYELLTTADGGVEVPIPAIFAATVETLDAAHAALVEAGQKPDAVSLTTFWHSFLGVDANCRPSTPILHLLDTRSEPYAVSLKRNLDEKAFHSRVGVVFHPSYWPAKMLWIRENRPDWWKNTVRWLSYGEYLLMEFFGEPAVSTSMLSATGIWNANTQSYDEGLLDYLDLPPEKLARLDLLDQPLRKLRPVYAERWPLFSEIPWYPAIGDGAANNIGCGCDEPSEFALMVGTTGAMRVVFETASMEAPPGLWRYRLDPKRFVVGGALSNGGKVFEWITERFRMPENWEAELASTRPGTHGLTVLPLFAGERSTKWRADARGAITGLNLNTTPVEILAAGLEAVALRFRLIYEILEARVGAPERVVATGEAMRKSPIWTQMMADALGRPVVASKEKETSARGAAMLVLEQLGVVSHLREIPSAFGEEYLPREEYREVYARMLKEQQTLYRKLFETE